MKSFAGIGCVLLVIAPILAVTAQKKKMAEGYIITHHQDTVPCIFNARNWGRQPFEIRINLYGKDSLIRPDQVKGLIIPSLSAEYKVKVIGPVKYEADKQFAVNGYLPDYDSARAAFLKVLYRGRLNLLMYQDRLERNHFFIEIGEEVAEIYSHLYSTAGGWHNREPIVTWHKQYVTILKIFMEQCKALYTLIDTMELNKKDLVQLFKVYDTCLAAKKEE